MENNELTISEIWDYLEKYYDGFIGTTETIDNNITGQSGITLNFYKPDRKIFIHITGEKNRNDIIDLIHSKINNLIKTI